MLPFNIQLIFAFVFGLTIGSFLNVCIYRLPLKRSIVTPPSACPACGYRIRFYDNIPVLSYMMLGGRCRKCGIHISLIYPAVELATGLTAWPFL
jgi:leader peptidase (prepilin peptidase)/N-methyltransferase